MQHLSHYLGYVQSKYVLFDARLPWFLRKFTRMPWYQSSSYRFWAGILSSGRQSWNTHFQTTPWEGRVILVGFLPVSSNIFVRSMAVASPLEEFVGVSYRTSGRYIDFLIAYTVILKSLLVSKIWDKQEPILLTRINFNAWMHEYVIKSIIKCGMEKLMHSQNSTV